jgi:sugar phosphate isomerase/epimerase
MEALERDLRRLVLLGGRTAVYHACLLRDVPEEKVEGAIDAAGWEAFAERTGRTIRRLAREAADAGITIVLENVWICRYSKSIEGIRRIIEAAEASNVGFILDSGHANLCGFSVADEIRRAGALLRDTHFHDNAGARVGVDQHIPPGLGTIDWQDACRALDEIAFAGPVVFEGVLGPGDSIEKGRFGGKLSHKDLIHITLNNWRAFEALAEQKSPRGVS